MKRNNPLPTWENGFKNGFDGLEKMVKEKKLYFLTSSGTGRYGMSYLSSHTYIRDNKLYNLVVTSCLKKYCYEQVNGLTIYQDDGGYYVKTRCGKFYINSIYGENKNLDIEVKD